MVRGLLLPKVARVLVIGGGTMNSSIYTVVGLAILLAIFGVPAIVPATLSLFGAGFLGIGFIHRHRDVKRVLGEPLFVTPLDQV
jgi:hypothetical protein